jgi:hypothetical protein
MSCMTITELDAGGHPVTSRQLPGMTAGIGVPAAWPIAANGDELPGGWRVVPELAAGGLWSSAADLAHL